MERLVGLIKAAKLSNGRSQKCATCRLHKERLCNTKIWRSCSDSFVDGFKKGAYHYKAKDKEQYLEAIQMFNADYGMNLSDRLNKLQEETDELKQAISEYIAGSNNVDAIIDEMSDVLAVMTHVSHLLGTNTDKMFDNALDKIIKRKKNSNYKRTHPHVE